MSRKNGKSSTKTKSDSRRGSRPQDDHGALRLPVLKTYKMYVGGKFPRGESGKYFLLRDASGSAIANLCAASRKDTRDAVVAARNAQSNWASRTAYLRSQILYRIAEMLEGRASQFVDELKLGGESEKDAAAEVRASVDRLVYYAGWADKFQQVFSSVNPVSSSHFNFSLLEPTGVVAIFAPETSGLLGLVSTVAPVICGGNSCIVLASQRRPLSAVTFGEVLATSDLPGGVVNILTGKRADVLDTFASHMDINACIYCGDDADDLRTIHEKAAGNVKRVVAYDRTDWLSEDAQSPYFILDTQEVKTTWHPVGV